MLANKYAHKKKHEHSPLQSVKIQPTQETVNLLSQQLRGAALPESAQGEAERELERLAATPITSSEYNGIRTYLDWLINLPWNKLSDGNVIDIERAKSILDKEHYNLEKVKDRIIEYLAVKKFLQERFLLDKNNNKLQQNFLSREPMFCFIGPHGVAKNSFCSALAQALNRKLIRLSLGGMHDPAEIRGHLRTYIGALPGRIIQELRRAGTRNPVFVLDEIDKVGNDWHDNLSAALLELLDPTQNYAFVDNYLAVPFDLSQVLFIATANTTEPIPKALLDRMEIIRFSGYSDDEKVHIAKRYLIPHQLAAHGLTTDELNFDTAAIRCIIRGYAREAGVRNLDRQIATVCRKVVANIATTPATSVHLTVHRVASYLGKAHYFDEVAERTTHPGTATGLAWTASGGDLLFIEVAIMPGREGQLLLTGMLGDVMQESAQIALSYVRSNLSRLKVDSKLLQDKAIHIHIPEGAITKDGPSAGITILIALVSLLIGKCVRDHIAMTGEVTLRGKILQVGGIKEKLLAAQRAGVKVVILPKRNESDLEEMPAELKKELEFILVDSAEQVLQYALGIEF